MIQCQLKLKPTRIQETTLLAWLNNLTGVWNWAVRKIEQDAADHIYYGGLNFQNLLAHHSSRLGVPSHTIQATIAVVWSVWNRCFKNLSKKPHLKGRRRPLRSIPFPDPLRDPSDGRISIQYLGKLKFHKQQIPSGKIKCGHIVKRASGWYLCLFIDAERAAIDRVSSGEVGIDPGFNHLLTLSTGEKVDHPRELETGARRLAQSQRGNHRRLTARLHERQMNRRKDRNHKLSLDLVRRFSEIYFSKDNAKGIASRFGKSVKSSSHSQLRSMLSYKSLAGGTRYVEVAASKSTVTCSACWAESGPRGLAGLKVRQWVCGCGAQHDRDCNSAVYTLKVGAGRAHEIPRERLSENHGRETMGRHNSNEWYERAESNA
jgi:putative transposase